MQKVFARCGRWSTEQETTTIEMGIDNVSISFQVEMIIPSSLLFQLEFLSIVSLIISSQFPILENIIM